MEVVIRAAPGPADGWGYLRPLAGTSAENYFNKTGKKPLTRVTFLHKLGFSGQLTMQFGLRAGAKKQSWSAGPRDASRTNRFVRTRFVYPDYSSSRFRRTGMP